MKIKKTLRIVTALFMAIMVIASTAGIVSADYQTTPNINGVIGVKLPVITRSDPLNTKPYINVLNWIAGNRTYYRVVFSSNKPNYIYNNYSLRYQYPAGTIEECWDIEVSNYAPLRWTKTEITTSGNGTKWGDWATCILVYSNSGCKYSTQVNNGITPMYANHTDGTFVSDSTANWIEALAYAYSGYTAPPAPTISNWTGIMPPMPSIDDLKITLNPIDLSTRLLDETAIISNTGIQTIDDIVNFIYRFFAGLYNKAQEIIAFLWNERLMPVLQVLVNIINRLIEILYPAMTAIYNVIASVANFAYGIYMMVKTGIKDKIIDIINAVMSIKNKIDDITSDVFNFVFGDIEVIKQKIIDVRTNFEDLLPASMFNHTGGGGGRFEIMQDQEIPQEQNIDTIGKGNITLGGQSYSVTFFDNEKVKQMLFYLRPEISKVVKVLIFFSDIAFLFSLTRTPKQKSGA